MLKNSLVWYDNMFINYSRHEKHVRTKSTIKYLKITEACIISICALHENYRHNSYPNIFVQCAQKKKRSYD